MTRTVIIIGGGAAGITAAYHLRQRGLAPIILEKTSELGGMCSTYAISDTVMTERGAVLVVPNYPILSEMRALDIHPQKKVAVRPLPDAERLKKLSWLNPRKHWFAAQFIWQQLKFMKDVHAYQTIKAHQDELPEIYQQPFADYLVMRGIHTGLDAYKALIPGCGYGPFEQIPTWLVFEYLGYLTILSSAPPGLGLKVVEGGYQTLFEKMAAGIDTETGVTILEISRNESGVYVTYEQDRTMHTLYGDDILLAIAPNQWPSLGMDLTTLEQQCAEQLQSLQYPVMIAYIKNMPKEFIFFPQALDEAGFNQVGLITTRDRRDDPEEGRLSTIYLNINESLNETLSEALNLLQQYSETKIDTDDEPDPDILEACDRLQSWLETQISTLVNNPEVAILEVKNWQYFRHLPWHLRTGLQSCQGDNQTYYAGAYMSFEDVACATTSAKEAVRLITDAPSPSSWQKMKTSLRNSFFFYHPSRHRKPSALHTQESEQSQTIHQRNFMAPSDTP